MRVKSYKGPHHAVLSASYYFLPFRSITLLSILFSDIKAPRLPPNYIILNFLQVLYRELGLTTSKLSSKHRRPSTSKEALMQIKHDHPLPGLILQWRKLNALVTKVVSYLMVLCIGLLKFFVNLGAVYVVRR
jgi:hypothetical protein